MVAEKRPKFVELYREIIWATPMTVLEHPGVLCWGFYVHRHGAMVYCIETHQGSLKIHIRDNVIGVSEPASHEKVIPNPDGASWACLIGHLKHDS
jgi:hypothetical protein